MKANIEGKTYDGTCGAIARRVDRIRDGQDAGSVGPQELDAIALAAALAALAELAQTPLAPLTEWDSTATTKNMPGAERRLSSAQDGPLRWCGSDLRRW